MSKLNIATGRNEYISCKLYTSKQIDDMVFLPPSTYCNKKIAIRDGTTNNTVYLVTGYLPDNILALDPSIQKVPLKFCKKDGTIDTDTIYTGLPDFTLSRGDLVTKYTSNVSTPVTLLAEDYPDGIEIAIGGSRGANGSNGSSGGNGKSYMSSSSDDMAKMPGAGGSAGAGGAGGKNVTVKFSVNDVDYTVTASGGAGGGGGGGGAGGGGWMGGSSAGGAGGAGGSGSYGTGVILRFIGTDVTIKSVTMTASGKNGYAGLAGTAGKGTSGYYSESSVNGDGGAGGVSGTGQPGTHGGTVGNQYQAPSGGRGGSATTIGLISCTYPKVVSKPTSFSNAAVEIYKCNRS